MNNKYVVDGDDIVNSKGHHYKINIIKGVKYVNVRQYHSKGLMSLARAKLSILKPIEEPEHYKVLRLDGDNTKV